MAEADGLPVAIKSAVDCTDFAASSARYGIVGVAALRIKPVDHVIGELLNASSRSFE